jgi:hypothetical protein
MMEVNSLSLKKKKCVTSRREVKKRLFSRKLRTCPVETLSSYYLESSEDNHMDCQSGQLVPEP